MASLTSEIKKRGSIKARLTNFTKFLKTFSDKLTFSDFELIQIAERLDAVQIVKSEFDDLQNEIENSIEDDLLQAQYEERENFESNYFHQVSIAKKILKDNEKHEAPQSGVFPLQMLNGNLIQGNNVRLPTINLPKFDGSYQNWLEFRDTFRSLIHENASIGEIQKFHYLRASLEAEAALIIKSLEISSQNYTLAWNALKERYDNNKLLIYNHVKSLFSYESVQRESAHSLRNLIDVFSKNLRALAQLNQPVSQWDTLLVYLITTKLDVTTLREWEIYKGDLDVPNFDDFRAFVKNRADMLEMVAHNQADKRKAFNSGRNSQTRGLLSTDSGTNSVSCVICNDGHFIQNCKTFLALAPIDREKKIHSLKLCTNCLKKGHFNKDCRRGNCRKCGSKHNTLLHKGTENIGNSSNDKEKSAAAKTTEDKPTINLSACSSISQVILSTAFVQVDDNEGHTHIVRALLDSGAQSSFITTKLCKNLKFRTEPVNISVLGLNNLSSNISSKCVLRFESIHNDFSIQKCFFVINEIAGDIPSEPIDVSNFKVPEQISLADPNYHTPGRIDMLLGSDVFWNLLSVGQISLGKNRPILQKTKLGWIISGPIKVEANTTSCHMANLYSPESEIQYSLSKFWEIENLGSEPVRSQDEQTCEEHFIKTTTRDKDGRFVVSLPLKEPITKLGESLEVAKKRFFALERKFQTKPEFKKSYCEFMEEYESLGHMKRVDSLEPNKICYYMPHHGVLKEDSITTKLRVVFDASAPSSSGISLNQIQYVGPQLQDSLFSILIRFRSHKFVICADIAKMYRQILLTPEQRPLHRILWRKNNDEALGVYEMQTITYGTTAASYLAVRCLFTIAADNVSEFPRIAHIIKTDFYVDDLLTGSNSLEEAACICRDVKNILKQGGFELRKFYSNDPSVLRYVDNKESALDVINISEHENTKTLGISWRPSLDKLIYNISEDTNEKSMITKRTILSNIAQIFDPLGLLAPCVITAKIMLQRLWLEKISWDESVSTSLFISWRDFRDQLPLLNSVLIDRRIICDNPIRIELHGFSDASEEAYGGCLYVRSIDENGLIHTELLCAKSKVAPLKTITLPRLELMAAWILAKLLKKTRDALHNVEFSKCYLWSDSTIVLGWIKQPPNKLKTFVSNRVAEIQQLTITDTWNHVSTKENPADLLSRGVKPKLLISNELWWKGPSFLKRDSKSWQKNDLLIENLPDMRIKRVQTFLIEMSEEYLIKNYSKLFKLKRVVGYIMRFQMNCRSKRDNLMPLSGNLTSEEIDHALLKLVAMSQSQYYKDEIAKIKAQRPVSKGKLASLNPFLDDRGILRVGGRLNNSKFRFEKKHPAILSSCSHLAKLIAEETHLRLLHAGPQHTLAVIRENFWIVSGRILVKRVVHKCIPCFRYNPKPTTPIMAPLPEMRLEPKLPFQVTGVDYAGPMSIKSKSGRGFKMSKAYVCLFVCAVTKAIHIELVTDLTKESFLLALKRFVSRRGRPSVIWSDNGTNFKAASQELIELGKFISNNKDELEEFFNRNEFNWKFIPPYSPHFGGLWEAGVKRMKYHLRRVTRDLILTFEQLDTLLIEIEAILNSRPLSPLSDSSHDLLPLTPQHFLIGRSSAYFQEPDLSHLSVNRMSLFQHLTQVKQHIWRRWSKEYVSELQQRTKWKSNHEALKVNSLVLLKEDNTPVMQWKLGRIEAIHTGADGVPRVASIRTQNGTVKRTFPRICPLPFDPDESH